MKNKWTRAMLAFLIWFGVSAVFSHISGYPPRKWIPFGVVIGAVLAIGTYRSKKQF